MARKYQKTVRFGGANTEAVFVTSKDDIVWEYFGNTMTGA
jgi:hypothetical protein